MSGTDPLGVFDDARLGVFDDHAYSALAVASAEQYQSAEPFPHGVYDDFLPHDLAVRLAASFPTFESIDWVVRDNEQNRRVYQHDETKLPALHREMLRELNGRQFLLFTETLTGIDNLIPDPYFIGGGIHLSGPGDFLKIHADFNWHHKLQAYRRVNALLYLSETWDEEWGGAIEFWDREMTGPVDLAFPRFNRLVVFSTSEHSNHGQRVPNTCPPGVTRKVLQPLLLLHPPRRRGRREDPHFTLYKTEASPFAVQLGADYRAGAASTRRAPLTDERALTTDDAVVGPQPGTIPVAGPWITEREVEAVAEATRRSWYGGAGVESRAFEAEFAAAVGRRHAIALPSCTSGLHLSLMALGVGPGDEVVVPDTTWIASARPDRLRRRHADLRRRGTRHVVRVGRIGPFGAHAPNEGAAARRPVRRVPRPRRVRGTRGRARASRSSRTPPRPPAACMPVAPPGRSGRSRRSASTAPRR